MRTFSEGISDESLSLLGMNSSRLRILDFSQGKQGHHSSALCRLLNEALSVRDPDEIRLSGTLTFNDVVNKLIQIVVNPLAVLVSREDRPVYPTQLVDNACKLMVAMITELSTRVTIEKPQPDAPGLASTLSSMTPLATPTRFSRVQMGRTWNTGNGSPDAICFTVDRSGISIAGATIYGASTATLDWVYELDLLDFSAAGPSADLAGQCTSG